ncbi:hypothetical protein TNCV_782601 [Trichonephila clavipes]|nr:hypothetical protein TNCV_782601 [Trichonephila clavipes]
MREILYKGILARSPQCSRRRRIDEDGINKSVAVDRRAANILKEALRLFTVMQTRSPPGGAAAYKLLHHSIDRLAANIVPKNNANLALSSTFRCISIQSPL